MEPEEVHMLDRGVNIQRARWGRRGMIASLLMGAGTLAVKSFSWFHFSPAQGGGLMIAVGPHSTVGELRVLGKLLRDKFRTVDAGVVMVFDDADAARQVRKGSRNVDETQFQAALVHQRAMYRKSLPRGEDSFTIYKPYPAVDEVIHFDDGLRKTS